MHQPKAFLFGAPRIERDGARVPVERRKTLALLAYLATMPGLHARTSLAAMLWPEADAGQARANLSRTLFDLRAAIGPECMDTGPDHVALHPAALFVDAVRFRACLAQVTAHGRSHETLCDACLSALAEAVELYAGDFLAGFSLRDAPDFDTWQTFQAESLRLELGEALEGLALAYADRNDSQRAMLHTRRWLSLDPLSEPAHRCLIRLYAASGDRAAAFAQYEACRNILQVELGIPPEHETVALYEQLKAGSIPSPYLATPADRSSALPSAVVRGMNNLPPPAGVFIGREAELSTVSARLADPACRLLTITGPGGAGKTRLAIEAGRAQLIHFPHGVCFVSLLAVDRPELVPAAVLQALGAAARGPLTPQQQVGRLLAERQMLLILDNFEHLLAVTPESGSQDATAILHDWLAAAGGLKLLVTSRERLNLRDEWLLPLSGLAIPDAPPQTDETFGEAGAAPDLAGYAATRFFLHCVQRVRTGYITDEAEARAIVRICRQVDGSPLAIELVTPWLRALSLQEIEHRLAQGLDLLTSSQRDLPARHRSMRATFDQSWRLLSAHERAVLCCCSIFRDAFTAEAAQAIAHASLTDLAGLLDRSWLRVSRSGRYDLHELTRQYCAEKLESEHPAETGETRAGVLERHDAYYTDQLDRWEQASRAAGYRIIANVGLAGDTAKLEDAWRRAVDADNVERIRLLLPLFDLQNLLGPARPDMSLMAAAIERLEAISRLTGQESMRSRALYPLAHLLLKQRDRCWLAGRGDQAGLCIEACRGLLTREGHDMEGWEEIDFLLRGSDPRHGDLHENRPIYLDAFRNAIASVDLMSGKLWPYRADTVSTVRNTYTTNLAGLLIYEGQYEEGRRLLAEIVPRLRDAHRPLPMCLLSEALWHQGEYHQGKKAAHEAIEAAREVGSTHFIGIGLLELARNETALGELAEARDHYQRSLAIAQSINMPGALAADLGGLGEIQLALGRPAAAVQLFRQALSYMEHLNVHRDPYIPIAAMGLGQALAALGDIPQARECFRRTLRLRSSLARTTMETITSAAELTAREGDPVRAVEWLAFIIMHPYTPHWVGRMARKLLAELEAELPPDVCAGAVERGRARELDGVVAEIVDWPASAGRPV